MKILIIDDDRAMRAVLSRILSVSGIEVLESGDLVEATHIIQTEVLDVVIADLNFLETAEENILERWSTLGKFKFVGMYAPGDEEIVQTLKRKNYRYFLRKPFKVPEISAVLSQTTGKIIDLEKKILPVEPKSELPQRKPSPEEKPVVKKRKKIYLLLPLVLVIAVVVFLLVNSGIVYLPVTIHFLRTYSILNSDPVGLVVKDKEIFILDIVSQRIYRYEKKTLTLKGSYALPYLPVTSFWMDKDDIYVFNEWEGKIQRYRTIGDTLSLVGSYQFDVKNVVSFCVFQGDFLAVTFTGDFYRFDREGRIIAHQKLPYKNVLGMAVSEDNLLILGENKIYQGQVSGGKFSPQRVYELPKKLLTDVPFSSFFAYRKKLYFTYQGKQKLIELPVIGLRRISQ